MSDLKQLNVRISPATLAQLNALAAAGQGTVTQIIIKAIDRLAQSELSKKESNPMDKLEWNQSTGNYEALVDNGKHIIEISAGEMDEEKNSYSRERFGVDYADADDAQTAIIDEEIESINGWIDRQVKHAAE